MKVAELQSFLGNFVPFVRAAGASEKVVTELSRTLQCLDPFKEKSLADFNAFLRKADEYDRTGKLSSPVSNGASKSRRTKAPAMTIDEAATIYTDLYARATDPALTFADIEAKLAAIGKLTEAHLKELAARAGVTVPAKGKKKILDVLTRRITELKASYERGQQYRFGA